MKKIYLFILFSFLLTSCSSGGKSTTDTISPSVTKVDEINTIDNSKLDSNKNIELELQKEIEERNKKIEDLNNTKKELQNTLKSLNDNISTFNKYVETTRQLIIVDINMIKSVRQGILTEGQITDENNNYYYQYLFTLSKSDREKELNRIDTLLDTLKDKNVFERLYYINFDENKKNSLSNTDKYIYELVNLYFKNAKYKKSVVLLLDNIKKDFDILKIEKLEGNLKNNLLNKGGDFFYYIKSFEDLKTNIQ